VGESEAGFPIILLLGHDAVEADDARTGMGDAGAPSVQSIAAPAQVGPYDVEAEEGETIVVVHHRNGRSRDAVQFADKEAGGVDAGKAGGVVQPGIPAFRGRPVAGDRDLAAVHHANDQLAVRHLDRALIRRSR
jgi:hypothetical protein